MESSSMDSSECSNLHPSEVQTVAGKIFLIKKNKVMTDIKKQTIGKLPLFNLASQADVIIVS